MKVHRNNLLIIVMLCTLALSINIENWKLQALKVTVQDEDEHSQTHDFLFADRNLNQIPLVNRYDAIQNISHATNHFKDIAYLDIKNVKFFYDNTNGTIIAEIVTNEDGNYNYADGATYGMAININPFQNATNPQIAEADYIYKFKFINGSWNKVLGIRHSDGKEESFDLVKLEPNNPLNAKKHNIIMNFNTKKIGQPDEFQVQFFASTNVNITNRLNYTLVDVIPWIEIPPSTIHIALDPDLNQVYPQDIKKVDIVISSNSKVASNYIQLGNNGSNNYYSGSCSLEGMSLLPRLLNNKEFCDYSNSCSTYCWNFEEKVALLDPVTNSHSIHATLITKDINAPSQEVTLTARDYPSTGLGIVAGVSNDISQTWHFRVGDHVSEFIDSGLNFPNKYPYIIGLISATGTFIIGVFLKKEDVFSTLKKISKR